MAMVRFFYFILFWIKFRIMALLKMGMSGREYILKAKKICTIHNLGTNILPELWPSSRMGITVLTSLELQVKLTRKHFQIRIILIIFHTCLLCSSNHTVKIFSIHQMFFLLLLSTNKAEQKKLKWVTLEKISSGLLWITLIITKNRYQYIFNIFFCFISPT